MKLKENFNVYLSDINIHYNTDALHEYYKNRFSRAIIAQFSLEFIRETNLEIPSKKVIQNEMFVSKL